jgi:AraC family transcriptional regulator
MGALKVRPVPTADPQSAVSTARAGLPTNLASWLSDTRLMARCNPEAIDGCLDLLEDLLQQTQTTPKRCAPPAGGLAPWQVRRVQRHIEANLASRLATADLAALVGLSENYFARAFRISVGAPPHAFVMTRRVAQAQTLMMESDLPLSQIALAVGLSDQAHLSRLFRHHVGTTPSAWRRRRPKHSGIRSPV